MLKRLGTLDLNSGDSVKNIGPFRGRLREFFVIREKLDVRDQRWNIMI